MNTDESKVFKKLQNSVSCALNLLRVRPHTESENLDLYINICQTDGKENTQN